MTEKGGEVANGSVPPLKDSWSIRPCIMYKHEYDDCTSWKARFHQYFVNGEDTDCSQWKIDFDNCCRYESNGNDVAAAEAIIRSEAERRQKRLQAHYANTTWEKRTQPPADWKKPLPEWMEKRNENTYLQIKQMEMDGRAEPGATAHLDSTTSFCVIM